MEIEPWALLGILLCTLSCGTILGVFLLAIFGGSARKKTPLPQKLATIRLGWKLPVPPQCPVCKVPATPAVYNTGDGWVWGWDCQSYKMCGPDDFAWVDGHDGLGEMIEWPFVESYVFSHDWEGLGFEEV